MKKLLEQIKDGIFGLAVGDALGVPYEFLDRDQMDKRPVRDMIGYGTHNQPEGTWSDDSSLTFCLMESLCNGYDLEDIASKFAAWFYENLWTPRGFVFDIGITTKNAIYQFKRGMTPDLCGGLDKYSNGNGSLMRILPLAYFLKDESDIHVRYDIIKGVSSITHGHLRSVFSCFIYVEYALLLMEGRDKFEAYEILKKPILDFAVQNDFNPKEITLFSRILEEDISEQDRFNIKGTGYVLRTLEAAFWCLLNSESYEEAVLKSINLGEDTDTTAAVTGGLAGLYYGYDTIPETWKFHKTRLFCFFFGQWKKEKNNKKETMKYTLQNIQEQFNKGRSLKYLFFWGHTPNQDGSIGKGCFSQWWNQSFRIDEINYKTAEHWMMAEKARLFKDSEILKEILVCNHPMEAKQLGRKVKGFDPNVWNQHKFEIVKKGNYYKFSQNDEMKEFLLNTKKRIIVEASPRDRIWGIGMGQANEKTQNPNLWRGQNLLGFALMEVRDELDP